MKYHVKNSEAIFALNRKLGSAIFAHWLVIGFPSLFRYYISISFGRNNFDKLTSNP